ncbi:MAG TPA: ParB N-terminal domain-containing protein, partial [Puia sp.]|nr:ParB N-terminal domain-containing protein [Puia sp.]
METTLTPPTVVVKIPLDQVLVVPEDNPRGPYPRQEVEEMASSLKLGGQQMPILLRPRGDDEKAQAHPDKPYKLIGGYLRMAAAPQAGLTALDAIVRDLTPRQARKAAILDNVRKDMHWLAWGEAAESLLADDPDLTHRQIGDLLARDHAWVTRALNLLKVLNKPAREALGVNYTKAGGYDLPEACALCLGGLATGGAGDQALIERAVKVALAQRLPLEKTKKLVDWVKKGGQPEDFGLKEPKDTPVDPLASFWPQLGPGFKVKYKGGEDYDIHISVQGGHKAWDTALAASRTLKALSDPNNITTAFQQFPLKKGIGFEGTQGFSPVGAVGKRGELAGGVALG